MDNFDSPISEEGCCELENHITTPEALNEIDRIYQIENAKNDNKELKLISLLYNSCKNINDFDKLYNYIKIQSVNFKTSNPFKPIIVNENKLNMTAYFLFALLKRGLIIDIQTGKRVNTIYNEHREFHKNNGFTDFSSFITMIGLAMGYVNQFMKNNYNNIVEEQINFIEEELNNG